MTQNTQKYTYVIIGGGRAGASAAKSIRSHDSTGSVIILSSEDQFPYDRPPLSKKLWQNQKSVDDLYIEERDFYAEQNIEIRCGTTIRSIDSENKTVSDSEDQSWGYSKLLLAPGVKSKKIPCPGGDLEGIVYYRTLDDYNILRNRLEPGFKVLVIGGGFIGSEMAAALSLQQVSVSMLFPEPYLGSGQFPASLGHAIQEDYQSRGILLYPGDKPEYIEKSTGMYQVTTQSGNRLSAHLIVAGVGAVPPLGLAKSAHLKIDDGIFVNDQLQTSNPDIYAAGDAISCYYPSLDKRVRIEHWDGARASGKIAGQNMTGNTTPYTTLPYFFSDLFDLGYEAVGEINTSLTMVEDWVTPFSKGVVYYLDEAVLKGVLLVDTWNKVVTARELIKPDRTYKPEELTGKIQ